MIKTLNIPISYLADAANKPRQWELVCFSVFIKIMRGDSKYMPHTTQSVKNDLKCNFYTAQRLVNDAKNNHDMFRYDYKRNVLTANKYAHRVEYTRRNEEIDTTYCLKIDVAKDLPKLSLSAISKLLRERLLLNAINAAYRTNEFLLWASDNMPSPRSRKVELTLKKLSNIIGRSKPTVIRMINDMKERKIIKAKQFNMVMVLDNVNEITMSEIKKEKHIRPFVINGRGFVRRANVYTLDDGRIERSFVHIIYSHKKRRTFNASEKSVDIMDTPLMAMFN